MTVSSVSSVGRVDYAQAPARPQPAPKDQAPARDTVEISAAAKQALVQKPLEATETPAQTSQEAAGGDPVAIAKLAKEKSALQ